MTEKQFTVTWNNDSRYIGSPCLVTEHETNAKAHNKIKFEGLLKQTDQKVKAAAILPDSKLNEVNQMSAACETLKC